MARKKTAAVLDDEPGESSVPSVLDLIEAKQFEPAIAILKERLVLERDEDTLRLLLRCQESTDDIPGILETLGELGVSNLRDRFFLGWAQVRSEQWDEGIATMRAVVAENRTEDTLYWLATALVRGRWYPASDGDPEFAQAYSLLEEAAGGSGKCSSRVHSFLLSLTPYSNKERRIEIALRAVSQGLSEFRIKLAEEHLRSNNDLGASDALSPCLDAEEVSSLAHWYAYVIDANLERWELASESLIKLQATSSEHNPRLAEHLGYSLMRSGRYEEARQAFTNAGGQRGIWADVFRLSWTALTFFAEHQIDAALQVTRDMVSIAHGFDTTEYAWEPLWIDGEHVLEPRGLPNPIDELHAAVQNSFNSGVKVISGLRPQLRFVKYLVWKGYQSNYDELRQAARYDLHPRVSFEMAHLWFERDEYSKALACFVEYAEWCLAEAPGETRPNLNLEFPWELRPENLTKADYRGLLDAMPSKLTAELLTLALRSPYLEAWRLKLMSDKQWKTLSETAHRLLQVAPDDATYLWDYALSKHYLKENDAAKQAYVRILSLNPNNASAHHNLSLIEKEGGDFEAAISHAQRATELSPSDELMSSNLAALSKQQVVVKQERSAREERCKAAVANWPDVKPLQRKLLEIALRMQDVTWNQVCEVADVTGEWIDRNYGKLVKLGMILEGDGYWEVNPHVVHLVEREASHAVVTQVFHQDESVLIKPIFNSRREYEVYAILVRLFPNCLVFPNMALSTIMPYDRMKAALDSDDFTFLLRSHVDACIVSTTHYLPLIAFEIDSEFHDAEDQQVRDARKNRIFELSGVPLVRLRTHGKPSRDDVERHIVELVRGLGAQLRRVDRRLSSIVDLEREIDFASFGTNDQSQPPSADSRLDHDPFADE